MPYQVGLRRDRSVPLSGEHPNPAVGNFAVDARFPGVKAWLAVDLSGWTHLRAEGEHYAFLDRPQYIRTSVVSCVLLV